MTEMTPTNEAWLRLYALAKQVGEVAPWTYMEESDLFGVKLPDTEDMVFISVMGMANEYTAISVYLGAEGLHAFWRLQDGEIEENPLTLFTVPQIQLAFGDRDEVEPEDRALFKRLGLKFRGKGKWPIFRVIEPGFLPWFIRQQDAQSMIIALEQLLEVAPRFEQNEMLFNPPDGLIDASDEDDEVVFVRVPTRTDQDITWADAFLIIPPPEPKPLQPNVDPDLLQKAQALPITSTITELGVFMTSMPTLGEDQRPFFPFLMLLVEADTAVVLGQDIFPPLPTMQEMWWNTPNHLLNILLNLGSVPKTIRVPVPRIVDLMEPVGSALRISFINVEECPTLNVVVNNLTAMMNNPLLGALANLGLDEELLEEMLADFDAEGFDFGIFDEDDKEVDKKPRKGKRRK
ncbi:MAG: hypothetical protein SF029_25205 [bacterium]|nr:hypothetical protein [bacterium]